MSRRSRLLWITSGFIFLILVIAEGLVLTVLRGHGCALQDNAVANVRHVITALVTYRTTYDHYPPTLAALGPPPPGQPFSAAAAGLITPDLALGNHRGYLFRYIRKLPSHASDKNEGYVVLADPVGEGPGRHHYFASEDAVVRSEESRVATQGSPVSLDPTCFCW